MFKIILKIIEIIIRIISKFIFFINKINYNTTDIFLAYQTEGQQQADAQWSHYSLNLQNFDNLNSLVIFIPFRDKWELTEKCLNSIFIQNIKNLEITVVLIDNASSENNTINGIKQIMNKNDINVKIEYFFIDIPFNFSTINNEAVKKYAYLNAKWFLFLNNDIEFISQDSLFDLIKKANLLGENTGAIGTTLIYPNKTIQHLFLAPGIKILAAHLGKKFTLNTNEKWYQQPRAVAAVTGACLLIRAENFIKVGTFDEQLSEIGQDLDLCLKLQKLGKINWVISNIIAIHHETITRKTFFKYHEIVYLYNKYGESLYNNQYLSNKFSTWSEKPSLNIFKFKYPYFWLFTKL